MLEIILDKLRTLKRIHPINTSYSQNAWILFDEKSEKRQIYIFKKEENEMMIATDGNIIRGKWELVKGSDLLVMNIKGQDNLYNVNIHNNQLLHLQKDNSKEELVFISEAKFDNLSQEEVNMQLLNSLGIVQELLIGEWTNKDVKLYIDTNNLEITFLEKYKSLSGTWSYNKKTRHIISKLNGKNELMYLQGITKNTLKYLHDDSVFQVEKVKTTS